MNEIIMYLKLIFGGVCAAITFVFGGIDTLFAILLSLMVIDYITGVLCGIKAKSLSSHTGFLGLLKKIGILCIVALSHFIGMMLDMPDIRSIVMGFYIANESISITENAGRLGVPLPKKLLAILEQMKED